MLITDPEGFLGTMLQVYLMPPVKYTSNTIASHPVWRHFYIKIGYNALLSFAASGVRIVNGHSDPNWCFVNLPIPEIYFSMSCRP